MKRDLVLVGGGGHCGSCIDVIEQEGTYRIVGIVDVPERLREKVLGYEIISADEDLPKLAVQYKHFLITIGQIKTPVKRVKIFRLLKELGVSLPIVVSPLAYVSRHASISEGTIVMHHAVINAGAEVGRNCIINTKALVEHDAVIGDHCHISTGASINGGVRIGDNTFFGSNAVSREYIQVGKDCIIGCNATVTKNVPEGSLLK